MYFIHYIQTYASVNRKGSELQEYVLQLKDSLIKNPCIWMRQAAGIASNGSST